MLGQEESGPAHQGARNSPETISHLTGVRARRGEADRAQSSSGPWPDPSHGVNSPKFSSIPFFPDLGQGATLFPGAGQAASRNEVQAGLFIPLPSPFGLPSVLVGGPTLLTWPQRCPPHACSHVRVFTLGLQAPIIPISPSTSTALLESQARLKERLCHSSSFSPARGVTTRRLSQMPWEAQGHCSPLVAGPRALQG